MKRMRSTHLQKPGVVERTSHPFNDVMYLVKSRALCTVVEARKKTTKKPVYEY